MCKACRTTRYVICVIQHKGVQMRSKSYLKQIEDSREDRFKDSTFIMKKKL